VADELYTAYSPTRTDPIDTSPQPELHKKLYIDHILETRHAHGIEGWREEESIFKVSRGKAESMHSI
jgi:hypothetical protein